MFNVYILNLASEQKRRYLCEGGLFAMQTPFHKVKHWRAIDDLNYKKTSDVIRDAIRDGFPSFQSYLDKGQQNAYNITLYTQTWNYCRFWRHLIENDETAMLIQDDRRLRKPYPRLVELFTELKKIDSDVQFLSLWYQLKFVPEQWLPSRRVPENPSFAYGICDLGACAGHIVTPKGAKISLEVVPGHFPPRVEYAMKARCGEREHFYTLIDETENIFHLTKETYIPSRILSDETEDGFVRPVQTTKD